MNRSSEESKVAFEAMFEHASIGILISGVEGKIERVNPAAARLFGYAPAELIGQKIEILIPADLRKNHVGHRERYGREMRPRPMGVGLDLSALRKDGTAFPIEISLAAYQRGDRQEIVSFVSDITKRKKDEEALKTLTEDLENKVAERTEELSHAIQELQQMNEKEKELGELKSRFVSMASHEFRTPLSGILTSASLIDRYNQSGEPEKIRKHIQTIKTSVHSLTNILNDFLSIDKLEEGRIECRLTPVNLEEFARDLAQDMQSLAKKDQVITHEHRGGKAPVFVDKDILRNVLINLLSNALKYSGEGSVVRFLTEIGEDLVAITVEDEGVGIPEAEQKHLFERFFRARNVTNVQGTGLGLNIVKRYLDLMGGTITYRSRENEGTAFVVSFPPGRES